jgi:hypothetical protein
VTYLEALDVLSSARGVSQEVVDAIEDEVRELRTRAEVAEMYLSHHEIDLRRAREEAARLRAIVHRPYAHTSDEVPF